MGTGLMAGLLTRLLTGLMAGLLIGLVGCTAPELEPNQPLPTDGRHGAVAIALLRSGVRDFNLLLNLRGVDHSFGRVVILRGQGDSLDWNSGPPYPRPAPMENPMGRLVVLLLPAGTYEIFKWLGQTLDGGFHGDGYDIYDDQLHLRFSVRPGTLSHLGVLHVALPAVPDYQAEFKPAYYTLHTGPVRETDTALLYRRYQDLAGIPIEQSTLNRVSEEKRRYFLFNKKVGDGLPMRRSFR